MKIETLRKKATWELKVMVKALSQPISSFLNTDEDNERLENAKQVLNERKGKQCYKQYTSHYVLRLCF